MHPAPRLVAAIAVVLLQLMLLGRGACPAAELAVSVDESASRVHAHHGTAPAPTSDDTPETPHDGAGCFMTSGCGAGGMHEAAILLAMDDAPRTAIVAFDTFARVLAKASPEPPPPRA